MPERRHTTSRPVPEAGDHEGWIDWWHIELVNALVTAKQNHVTYRIVAEQHAIRSARMLHWHAIKLRPSIAKD